MHKEINKCRICGNEELVSVLDLGKQVLTGVFPKNPDEIISKGPLELVKCCEDEAGQNCGLVQLRHSYNLDEMYGENYGYRSGLNKSMVGHLQKKVSKIQELVTLVPGDLVVDIGSNDSTLLQSYAQKDLVLVGVDPTADKFKEFYPDHIMAVPDFFSAKVLRKAVGDKKAKVVTSIAMFYDLESPLDFMRQIYEILADDGVWIVEQSYLPTMLKMNAYDTVCHEHLEYYRLKQIKWMAGRVGLKIIDVEFNGINGGSFSIAAAKTNSPYQENVALVNKIMAAERAAKLHSLKPYEEFKQRVYAHRDKLLGFFKNARDEGKKIFGYGASTKGNVVLQFCGLSKQNIPYIAEVNQNKYGCFTPGTLIPIIAEQEAKAMGPDYLMVLPWHFKDFIIAKEIDYLCAGGKLLIPLPELIIISSQGEDKA